MPKRRYAAEKESEVSLLPALILLIVIACLYFLDVDFIDAVLSAIQPVNPLN